MWDPLWTSVFVAFISMCANGLCKIQIEPGDLTVANCENISVTCTINDTSLRSRYNASHLTFKFLLADSPTDGEDVSSAQADDFDVRDNEVSSEGDSSEYNATGDFGSNCFEDLSEYDNLGDKSVTVDQSYVEVVDQYTARLRYPGLTKEFNDAVLNCFIDDEDMWKYAYDSVHVLVGERPYLPIVINSTVKNWEKFEFHWVTEKRNSLYTTKYEAWYKHSSFDDFRKCPQQENCDQFCKQFCEVDIVDLKLDHYLSDSTMIFKVNVTNVIGTATSPDSVVDLYDIVTPDPVHDVVLHFNLVEASVCIKFKSPKSGAEMIYEVRTNCSEQLNFTSLLESNASNVKKCISNLPFYTNCSISIRAKPYSYGRWSSWSMAFTTPQTVPLAAAEVCRSCYELLSTSDCEACGVRVFPKPLERAVARGRVVTYRASLTMDDRYLTPVSQVNFITGNSGVDFTGLDLKSVYSVTVVAATEAGFNKSIVAVPTTVSLPASRKLREWPRNITAFILNSTAVRLSWVCRHPGLSGFTVFWCRVATLNQCKDQLQWSSMPSNVTRLDITDLPAFDLLNYLFGVAVETEDGYSSGIAWTKCLYNLSRVSSRPLVGSKVNRMKVQLNFSKDSECNAGFPYAYHVKYCPVLENDSKCPAGSATELIVGDDTCEVDHLVEDTKYLFVVSSLSVAGPSLSNTIINVTIPGKSEISSPYIAVIAIIAVGLLLGVVVTVRKFYPRIRNWLNFRIVAPPVAVVDDPMQPQNFTDDSVQYPDYTRINETSFDVRENGSSSSNGWSRNPDSSFEHLIPKNLHVVRDPSFRGRCITEVVEDDNVSVASGNASLLSDNQTDNYACTKICSKPDVVPSSPPVEPSFPFDDRSSSLSNCIVLDLGDVGSDLPQPQSLTRAADSGSKGDNSNPSSCGYAVGRVGDRQSGPSASAADDISVENPSSGIEVDTGHGDRPLSSPVVDLFSGKQGGNDTRDVHPQVRADDLPDRGSTGDVTTSNKHLHPYSTTVAEVHRPPDGSRSSDDDYNSSIHSSSDGYAVANLKNKYDPQLDDPAADVTCPSDGEDSDGSTVEYASVALLNNKQIADGTESPTQASNIPPSLFSVSARVCDPA